MKKNSKRTGSKVEYIKIFMSFTRKLKYDYVSAFAGNAALFMLMSFFPMLLYCISVFSYLPVDSATLTKYFLELLPQSVIAFLTDIIKEAYMGSSSVMQSFTFIVTLVCASKGVYAIIMGMNAVYGIRETRNFIILYILSVIYVLAFFGMLGLTLLLIVLGNKLFKALFTFFPLLEEFQGAFTVGKYLSMLVLLLALMLLIYMHVPNRKSKIRYEFTGAFFSTIVWLVFSSIFSYYIDHYAHYSVTYGSLATIIIFILWLYGTMYIIFIGAEINVVLRKFAEYDHNYHRAYDYYNNEYEGDLMNEKDLLVRIEKWKK